MITMRLSAAAMTMQGTLNGEDRSFAGCSIDSRTVKQGELFVAINGEHFDGHDFIQSALNNGATAALVDKHDIKTDTSFICVDNTREKLAVLANEWRNQFSIPVIAITGSNGKTTVKEMTTAILAVEGKVLSTKGNLNNDLGLPLTLCRMADEHQYAVLEIGANHRGEIKQLCDMAKPKVAVITLCAPAHLQGFGSIAGVADAKAEIYDGLDADSIAVINADDDFYQYWCERSAHSRQISFGLDSCANVRAENIALRPEDDGSSFTLMTNTGSVDIKLNLLGEYNIRNALAAAACCQAVDISLNQIKQGLESMQPVSGRMQIVSGKKQTRLFDDTYNANPVSLQAAMQVVSQYPGDKYLILGDMGELGEQAADFHLEAGEYARRLGFNKLIAIGELAAQAVRGFGEGAILYRNKEDLIDDILPLLNPELNILVKGSRFMSMDVVVSALSEVQ